MADSNFQAQTAATPATTEGISAFETLLNEEFQPLPPQAKGAVHAAVATLAKHALKDTHLVGDDVIEKIQGIIAQLDKKLSEQVSEIIHAEEFKTLEGSWRGLHYLVNNTETDEKLMIKVMNISKSDVRKTLKKFKGTAWDQSPLHKQIYEDEFGTPGGKPFGCLMGDYQFDQAAPDVEMLAGIAKIAAGAHCPFIAAASPTLLNMASWQDLGKTRDLAKIFKTDDYAQWRSLRASEDSRYLGLTMPRVLARRPYGAKTEPVEEFAFEEDTEGGNHNKYCWMNSAYAMATNINRAFKKNGWCARIRGVESGGMVEDLPVHTFPTDDGGVDMKCPTEIAITDRREQELATSGLIPLSHWKNTDYAVFMGAQSVQKPHEYEDPDATANANLAARLPYLFATCRFAHYLKCIVRDKIGSFKERHDMEQWLNTWIKRYCRDGSTLGEEGKAMYPLADASVEVKDVEGNPGYYTSVFRLRPHFQLEGLKISLRLVSKLPSEKGK